MEWNNVRRGIARNGRENGRSPNLDAMASTVLAMSAKPTSKLGFAFSPR